MFALAKKKVVEKSQQTDSGLAGSKKPGEMSQQAVQRKLGPAIGVVVGARLTSHLPSGGPVAVARPYDKGKSVAVANRKVIGRAKAAVASANRGSIEKRLAVDPGHAEPQKRLRTVDEPGKADGWSVPTGGSVLDGRGKAGVRGLFNSPPLEGDRADNSQTPYHVYALNATYRMVQAMS